MNVSSWKTAIALVGLMLVLPQIGASAADQPQSANRQANNMDSHFASCLILDNDNEVEVAKIAEKKSQNKDVQKFASMLVADHTKFINDLERFGGTATRRRDRTSGARDGQSTVSNAATSRTANSENHDMHLKIKEELAEQCLVSARKELDGKSGKEFDECFLGMQVGGHMHMLDTLKVLQRHASPEMQSVMKKGEETTQRHLTQAKTLKKNIAHNGQQAAREKEPSTAK